MTAAHTTLPIPTWVEVTHLGNGKRVILKVNDRGPFLHSRIIDLSYGAAQALDMVNEGTARVEVRALGAVGRAVPGVERSTEQIYIQVGAFAQRPNASEMADRLEAAGYALVGIDSDLSQTPALYRVRIGPFARSDNIADVVDDLSAAGVSGTYLIVEQ